MCLFCYKSCVAWCKTLALHDYLCPLIVLAKLIITLPLLVLLMTWALILSVGKTPYASYLAMMDSCSWYKDTIKDADSTYHADGTPRSDEVCDCTNSRKRCAGECLCVASPIYAVWWCLIPVQIIVLMVGVTVLCTALFESHDVVFGGAGNAVGERFRKRMVEIDRQTSALGFGNGGICRVFKEATKALATPLQVPPANVKEQEQADAALAFSLQQEEQFLQPTPVVPMPPMRPEEASAPPMTPEAVRSRTTARQEEIIENGRRVMAGLGVAARFGMSLAAVAAKEAKRVYEEKKEKERRERGEGVPPVAVAYPVADGYKV